MGDERPEARFALPAVKVGGERRALHGERDLEPERLEAVRDLLGDLAGRVGEQQAPNIGADRELRGEDGVAAFESQLASDLLGQVVIRDPHGLGVLPEPGEGLVWELPVGVLRRGDNCRS